MPPTTFAMKTLPHDLGHCFGLSFNLQPHNSHEKLSKLFKGFFLPSQISCLLQRAYWDFFCETPDWNIETILNYVANLTQSSPLFAQSTILGLLHKLYHFKQTTVSVAAASL